MASYKIIFKPSTEKDLAALPKSVVARAFKRIEALKDDPFPRQSIKFWLGRNSCIVYALEITGLYMGSIRTSRK